MPHFDTPGPITADIRLPVGELRLVAGPRPDTVVTVTPRNPRRSADVALAEQTSVTYADGRLVVESPARRWSVIGAGASIDITVELPTGSDVRADCAVGSIRTEGPLGRCALRAKVGAVSVEHLAGGEVKADVGEVRIGVSEAPLEVVSSVGMVRVDDLRAPARLRNSHGGIAVRRSSGELEATCSSGPITVERSDGPLTALTTHGSVRVGSVSVGTVRLESTHGELEVGVALGVPVWLDAHTSRGVVRNLLERSGAPEPGEPFVELLARTGNGDIIVRRSPQPPRAPAVERRPEPVAG